MALKRILVVDDEENIGRSLRLILEREGYADSTCASVAEGRKRNPSAPMLTLLMCGCRTAVGSTWCAG